MAISKDWYHTEMKNDDMEILHRSPSVEYSFYNAVRSGDMETVTANCKNDSFLHLEGTGVLSRNPLTNIKYHFVVTAAMLTRYCIDGGLEPEQAYRLSDFYILKMDSCTFRIWLNIQGCPAIIFPVYSSRILVYRSVTTSVNRK